MTILISKYMLAGSTKKGNNHIIHSIKLIKINGSVLCMNISHNSRNLAVGTDQGYVSYHLLFIINVNTTKGFR